ncbi:MAG: tail fiber domain-containing protein [Phycisphaerales bacterium]|nr:MAG: tail fiber domain-containing protein [Phycisphaerales bacterium]
MRMLFALIAMLGVVSVPAYPATFTVKNVDDGGPGSLRQAMLDANVSVGIDNIIFDIPGDGPHIISPVDPLPFITDAVVIDGYTQPGTSANKLAQSDDADLRIVLDGSRSTGSGISGSGLVIQANDVTIRGLVINQFPGQGIYGVGNGCVIEGNFIGTDAKGASGQGNRSVGISWYGGNDLRIGGDTPAARNVISANRGGGVLLVNRSLNFVIQGNFIGVDATGRAVLGNGNLGISVNSGVEDCLIGGTAKRAANVIAGNENGGISLSGGTASSAARRIRVQGNYIGTDMTAQKQLGNGIGSGIGWFHLFNGMIGGTEPGAGNVIAFNQIGIGTAGNAGDFGNSALGNSIFANTYLGIDLLGNGVTPNDPGDTDGGANGLQNFPVLLRLESDGATSVTIEGVLDSLPDSSFLLEFFDNAAGDPSGYGEGERLIGRANVSTDSDGFAYFLVTFPAVVPEGHVITATATAEDGSTSEFSAWKVVEPPAPGPSATVFTYQGNLQDNGHPAQGLFDFEFAIFDRPVSGTLLKKQPVFDDVAVVDGGFVVELDFGSSVFNGQARYLEISVRPGESSNPAEFVTLEPRQLISSTPYALQTRGIFVDDSRNVGIGTVLPDSPLTVAGLIESTTGGFQFPDGTIQTTAANAGPQLWQSRGTDVYHLNGNVGIGTAAPNAGLHLRRFLAPAAIRLETSFFESASPTEVSGNPATVETSTFGLQWSDLQESLVQDSVFASVSLSETAGGLDLDSSQVLRFSDFGFGLPSEATVAGVVVRIDGQSTCGISEPSGCDLCRVPIVVELVTDKSASQPRIVEFTNEFGLPTTSIVVGSVSDGWGLALSAADVSTPGFGLRLRAELTLENCGIFGCSPCDGDAVASAFIDGVTVRVSYYESGSLQLRQVDWSLGVPEGDSSFRISPDSELATGGVTVDVGGNLTAKSLTEISSRKHKRNIRPITGALDKVAALQGVSFDWVEEQGGERDIGLLGENVAKVLPELVDLARDGESAEGLKYGHLTAVLVEAIKELRAQKERDIAALKARNRELQQRIEVLEEAVTIRSGKEMSE